MRTNLCDLSLTCSIEYSANADQVDSILYKDRKHIRMNGMLSEIQFFDRYSREDPVRLIGTVERTL